MNYMKFGTVSDICLVVLGIITIIISIIVSLNRSHQKKINFLYKRTAETREEIVNFYIFAQEEIKKYNNEFGNAENVVKKSKINNEKYQQQIFQEMIIKFSNEYKIKFVWKSTLLSSQLIKYYSEDSEENGMVKRVKIYSMFKPSTWKRINTSDTKKSKGKMLEKIFNDMIEIHTLPTNALKTVNGVPSIALRKLPDFISDFTNLMLNNIEEMQNIINGFSNEKFDKNGFAKFKEKYKLD